MVEPHSLKANKLAQCSCQPHQPMEFDTFKNCRASLALLYLAFPSFCSGPPYAKVIMQEFEGKFSMNIITLQEGLYMIIVFFCVLLLDLMAYWFQRVE